MSTAFVQDHVTLAEEPSDASGEAACSTALAAIALLVARRRARRSEYPSRLITIVVPITPGTTIDILARLYADKLAKKFGQQVVVANRPGAGGLIAAQAVANAPADGYTVLFANSGHAILGTLNKNLPFDPVARFRRRRRWSAKRRASSRCAPSLGVSNLKEFVELAKAKPGTINYGSAGIGTATHLAGAYFALKTGTDLVHVPYTVSATIIADLLGGRIQASFVPMAFVLPLLQDGRLRALAVVAEGAGHRSDRDPDRAVAGRRLPERAPGTACWRRARRRSRCSPCSTRRSRRRARTPSLQAKIRVQGIDPRDIGLDKFDAPYPRRHGAPRAAVEVDQRGALKPAPSFFRRVFLAVRPACAVLMPERHTRSRT